MDSNLIVWISCGGFMTTLVGYVIGSVGVNKVEKKMEDNYVENKVCHLHTKTMYKKLDEVAADIKILLRNGGNHESH